jgi:hypothetical protein
MNMTEKQKELFWSKVDKNSEFCGCWDWIGRRSKKGYGEIDLIQYSHPYTHRVSWCLHFGDIPDGMCVLHECDNPSCVNPDHLFLGTNQDNVDDKCRKGRHKVGMDTRSSKLTNEEVLEIRKLHNDHIRISDISRMYGRSYNTIRRITIGVTWKHLF